jgi:hypothetical protein
VTSGRRSAHLSLGRGRRAARSLKSKGSECAAGEGREECGATARNGLGRELVARVSRPSPDAPHDHRELRELEVASTSPEGEVALRPRAPQADANSAERTRMALFETRAAARLTPINLK